MLRAASHNVEVCNHCRGAPPCRIWVKYGGAGHRRRPSGLRPEADPRANLCMLYPWLPRPTMPRQPLPRPADRCSPTSLKGGPDRQGLGGDGGRSGPCAFLGGKVAGPCVMLAPKFAAKKAAPILFKSSSPATVCSKGCGHIEREKAPERHISQTTVSAAKEKTATEPSQSIQIAWHGSPWPPCPYLPDRVCSILTREAEASLKG